jgi:transcriptional regulator with XRE-family HTH domain
MKSDIDNTEVGKRLQNFREVRGLTRAVVALRLGTKRTLRTLRLGKSSFLLKILRS